MRDKARSKSPLCKVDKESPKREKKAVSTISTAYGSGVRKEHDEKKLDAVNNLKSKPIHSLPEAMHQCTLQSLGPEDKQKVTKLLKQVVDMGKENKSLKEDHEKELKNLNDRVQQLQTCTKNMARENVSLKSKLSQMLIVLRTYQHKVLLMDAALKASSHAGGTLQTVMQGQDQHVQQGQDQPPVQRGQDQQGHDSVLLTSNQSFRQDGHVAETGIYSPTQMTEASGGHATAADSQGVATSPAASASAAGLVLQPAATAFEPSFQPSNNHSHVLLVAQSTPTAASNTSSCQQTTTCALHTSYSEINNVQQSLPAFDAPSIPAVHNSYHSVFNSEAGGASPDPDPVTSTSAAYNPPFEQQVMINHDGSLPSTGEVEPLLVTTSAIASSNSIQPGARQSTALTNIPATAYGTINITIQHLQEQLPIRDMGLAIKSDSLQQASWSSDQGHTPHDVHPLPGKHSSEVIPLLTYPKTSEELSTQARHEGAEAVEMCFISGRREVGIQCSATDSPRQECRVETTDETMAEVAEGKIENKGAALSQTSMNVPDRHDVSTTIKKEPPSTLIFRQTLGMGARRPESRYPTIITNNQNSPKEKGNSSSSPSSSLSAADHLLASSHGIPRPSRYLPPTITREALLNPHHASMHGSTKPLLGKSLVVAASTSSGFNGPIEEEEVCSGSTEEAHISSPILVMSGDIAAAEIAARLREWQASQGLFVEDHEGHQAAASNKALCYDPSIGASGAFYFSDVPVVDNKQTKNNTLRPALNTVQTLSDTAELPPPLCDRLTHPHGGCNKPPPCVANVTPSSSISVLRNNVDSSSTSTAVSRSSPPTDSALVQYPCQDSQNEVPTPSPSCSGSCQAQVPSHTGAAYSKAKNSGSAGSETRSGTSSSKAVQQGPHSRSLNTVASDVCVEGVHIRDQEGGRILRGRMPGFVTMAEQDSLSMLSGRDIKLFDTDEVTSNNPAQISGFQEVPEFDLVELLRQAEEFQVNSPAMQPQLMRPGSASSSTQIVRTAARTSTRRATTTSSPRVLMASPSSVAIAAQQGQQQVLAPHQTIPEYEENDLLLAILQQELSIGRDMSNRTNSVL